MRTRRRNRSRRPREGSGGLPLRWLLVPLLFAAAPLVSFYASNAAQLEISEMLGPMAQGVAAAAVLTAVLFALLRDVALTSVIASMLAAVFFYYGHASTVVAGAIAPRGGSETLANVGLISVLALAIGVLIVLVAKRRDRAVAFAKVFGVMGASLMLTASAAAVFVQIEAAADSTSVSQEAQVTEEEGDADGDMAELPSAVSTSSKTASDVQPDIYYIVLDAYASNAALEELGFDNSEFTDYLESRGFSVAHDSKSNYSQTFMALASVLDMDYINDVVKGMRGRDRTRLNAVIHKNKVARVLRKNGYRYVHVASGWGATDHSPLADVVLETGENEIKASLRGTMMFRPTSDRTATKKKHEAVRRSFRYISNVKNDRKPNFVFAHILVPHGPYAFNADGSQASGRQSDMSNWNSKQKGNFFAQLQGTNLMTKRFIDHVIETSERPVVIIIQGDHGTGFTTGASASESERMIIRRHSVLNAMYMSEGVPEQFHSSVSPVNTFRIVLNEVLGKRYPMLKDRSYNSRDYNNPYVLRDVTDLVSQDATGTDTGQ